MGKSYTELIGWQKSMALVTAVYKATQTFPREELYGLTSQMRRAAVSVPSNIAEGQSRYSKREFGHFLGNARGSLSELETQVLIAQDLGYIDRDAATRLLTQAAEVGRILNGLRASLRLGTEN